MSTIGFVGGGQRKKEALDRERVGIRDPGEGGVGKSRIVRPALRGNAMFERAQEIRIRPAADARSRVRGNIRAIEDTEGGFERPPARILDTVRLRMTADTICGRG